MYIKNIKYTNVYVYIHINTYLYMQIYVYVYVHICICIYTYMSSELRFSPGLRITATESSSLTFPRDVSSTYEFLSRETQKKF